MTAIECVTQRAPPLLGSGRRRRLAREYIIRVEIDGATMEYSEPFQYMKDSEITAINPGATIHRFVKRVVLFIVHVVGIFFRKV